MKSAIGQAFEAAAAQGRAAFVPFLTGGFPDPDSFVHALLALDKAGADVIEVGLPYSDPVADGKVIMDSSQAALEAGATPASVLEQMALAAHDMKAPLVVMTYWNPVLRMGPERFAHEAKKAGASGVIVPDLPPEEGADWARMARENGLDTIFMATPTTDRERLAKVLELCSGFLYYVSMTGVTGAGLEVGPELLDKLQELRAAAGIPVAVGFGVSTPQQAASLGTACDGVIVGSALVRVMQTAADGPAAVRAAGDLASELRSALG